MSNKTYILLAEDEQMLAEILCDTLGDRGFDVQLAYDGEQALQAVRAKRFDVIVTDVMMPRMDGFEFTETIRQSGSNTPILMVTAKTSPVDKRKGFIIGTDDYMTKPVDEEEMVLRVGALLRRAKIASEKKLTVGSTSLHYDSFTVVCGDTTNEHPQKEFLLLFKLLSYPGKIFTRRQLMDEIWGMNSTSIDTTVNVHINRLRKKFGEYPEFKILAIKGIGYKAVINQ